MNGERGTYRRALWPRRHPLAGIEKLHRDCIGQHGANPRLHKVPPYLQQRLGDGEHRATSYLVGVDTDAIIQRLPRAATYPLNPDCVCVACALCMLFVHMCARMCARRGGQMSFDPLLQEITEKRITISP